MTCHAYAIIINQQTDENPGTQTHTHTHTHINQFTHTPRIWILGTVTPPYAIGYQIWSQTLPAQFGTKGTSPRWIWCSQHGFLIFLNMNQSWMSISSLLAQKIRGLRCYCSKIHSQHKLMGYNVNINAFFLVVSEEQRVTWKSIRFSQKAHGQLDILAVSHTLMCHRLPCWKA